MNKVEYKLKDCKTSKRVVKVYKTIERSVVGAYKWIESGVVRSYKCTEDSFVNKFLEKKEPNKNK